MIHKIYNKDSTLIPTRILNIDASNGHILYAEDSKNELLIHEK